MKPDISYEDIEDKRVMCLERYETMEEVRKHIQECEGQHSQQVAYSTFHDGLTQICFGCNTVRTTLHV